MEEEPEPIVQVIDFMNKAKIVYLFSGSENSGTA